MAQEVKKIFNQAETGEEYYLNKILKRANNNVMCAKGSPIVDE